MKILVYTGALKAKHLEMIKSTASLINADVCFNDSINDIPEAYRDAEVVYGYGMEVVNAETVRKNADLKWISVTSAGIEFLLKPGMFANEDVIITNASGAYGVSIAEHIIAVSLMMMRKLTKQVEASLQGRWEDPAAQKSLKDCRITVLGTGDIGCSFARRAKAFEPAKLVGVSRSGKRRDEAFDEMLPIERLEDILPLTDLLVMSLPGTPETENILSRERIALLPEGAYIVNVGRGSAIDEDALADSLDDGKLGGAALDVFRCEPLPGDSRLWTVKNLLITPHIAGRLTLEYTLDTNVKLFCDNLLNYSEGKPMKNVVDKERGY
ncbi:MAG: D-2-hydroxyacid dehydrogenase [Lachnospiraceae bacterium]|nr:D-2-hydroxyacid dehydrogenase [Lachnospiraceae bacterium]